MPRHLPAGAFSLTVLAALVLLAGRAQALQVTGIDAQNKHGQTFLTWDNLPGNGWKYRVYVTPGAVQSLTDFMDNALELGAVGDSSAMDRRISTLRGSVMAYHTDSAGPEMPLNRGLFVTTPTQTGLVCYTILAESATYPLDFHFYPGQNTSATPVWEVFAMPQPIWQRSLTGPRCEDYVLFASNADQPGFPAMWSSDSHALHFGVIRGQPGGALVINGHGRGGSFLNSITGTNTPGETVIAPDDYLQTWDVSTFYLGFSNSYDPTVAVNTPATSGEVMDYTDRFILHLVDWAQANFATDRNRVYTFGSSMGGTFAFFFAWHHPDRVAAAMANVPKLCLGYKGDTAPNLSQSFERLWSRVDVNLPTIEGIPVFDWMDGRVMTERFYGRGAAPVFGFVGKNDVIVGWQEKVAFFQAMEQNRAGGAWYWDGRAHSDATSQATWAPVQEDCRQVYRYRLDRSYPALSHCTADSDPGDGSPTSGDAVGTINGFVGWDEELVDTRDTWSCVLRPRALPTRDGTLTAGAAISVDVTPRRLQQFLVSDRADYRYTVTDATSGALLASGVIEPDASYLLTVPGVPVSDGGSRVQLQALSSLAVGDGAAPRLPQLALAANPVRGATTLHVEWPSEGDARVDLFDVAGRHARTLFAAAARGEASIALDARDLAPGIYVVHARQGAMQSSRRVVIVR
jgi:dienelactone hydrolase